ncbi:MAG: 5-formyltetrahydrofolate cyclo-ligase [Thiobacillaceae bacterium]|jgi:5-formyltetrahydrofolate cyclo-ligase
MNIPSKPDLRRHYRNARSKLSDHVRHHAEHQALRHAIRSGLLLKGKRWGVYLPFGSEFDVLALANQILWMRKQVFVPILPSRPAKPLRFVRLGKNQRLAQNRHNISEPLSQQRVGARQLDVLLVPLVAYDSRGVRLGMGGGYYDATLAYFKIRSFLHKPKLIGVAYACQQAPELPAEPWDVQLDGVLTETGLTFF